MRLLSVVETEMMVTLPIKAGDQRNTGKKIMDGNLKWPY